MSALLAIYPLEISIENDALIETYHHHSIVYEPWAEGLSCRLIVRPLACAESIVPGWVLLDREGAYQRDLALRRVPYLDQVEKLGDAAEGASHLLLVSSTDGDPEFGIADTFFDEIPSDYRHLVAPLGGFQWLALNAIAAEPRFADHLATELAEFGPSFVTTCWALWPDRLHHQARRSELARLMIDCPKLELGSRLSGWPWGATEIEILERYRPAKPDIGFQQWLIWCLRDPARRAQLARTPVINKSIVEWARRAPVWMCEPNVLMALSVGGDDLRFSGAIPTEIAHIQPHEIARRRKELDRVTGLHELEDLMISWRREFDPDPRK